MEVSNKQHWMYQVRQGLWKDGSLVLDLTGKAKQDGINEKSCSGKIQSVRREIYVREGGGKPNGTEGLEEGQGPRQGEKETKGENARDAK